MRNWKPLGPLIWISLTCPALAEEPKRAETPPACSSFTEAKKHIGERHCISGKVLRVDRSPGGMAFLDFCEDYRACPFTVVVFAEDLHHVGDLNPLVGRSIEISGKVKDYDGRAEIVLQDAAQLGGVSNRLPPTPKEFDVERQGKFSAGTFHAPKNRKPSHKKATLPTTTDVEDNDAR